MQEIQYYADEEGRKPVQEFIDALDCKMQAKVFGRLELLEEYGPMLGCHWQSIWTMAFSNSEPYKATT